MKTRNLFVKITAVLALLSILITACSSAQRTSMSPQEIESVLIAMEQKKWDMFRAGTFSEVSNMYADDFINIVSNPAGTFRQNKQEANAALASLPPMDGEITLSDFIVVHPDEDTAIVSYKVTAFFGNEYVTSVWTLRDGEWKTVFYQGTPILDPAPPVSNTPAKVTIDIPFFGRYKSDSPAGGKDALLFSADGSYAVDVRATMQYGTTGRFEIKGNHIIFTDDERTDVPVCKGSARSGIYQFTYTGDTLVFTKVDDSCTQREAYFADRTWEK